MSKEFLMPVLLLAAATAALSAWRAGALAPPPAPDRPAVRLHDERRLEVEHLTLSPAGFEPAEITRPQGPFVLAVNDRTGLEGVELRFEREGGGALHALRARSRRRSWSEEVNPPPGRYVLSAPGRPGWRCVVTVTAR